MLRNYFKMAYRTLLTNRLVSAINIFGLSIAIGCSVVVYLFLYNHWTMDSFHSNGERIFIVEYVTESEGQEQVWGTSPMPLGPALEAEFPEVERAVRFETQGCKVYLEDQAFEELVSFADTGYFEMFSFPLRRGNPEALKEPDAVIVSHEIARKYFKDGEAYGKAIVIVFENQVKRVFTIKGVAEPFPENTGFKFDVLTGFNTLGTLLPHSLSDWKTQTRGTFVQLRRPEEAASLAKSAGKFAAVHNAVNSELKIQSFVLDNLKHPNPGADEVLRRPAFVAPPLLTVMFSLIALLMMALSSLNHINISLGYVGMRVKEIGVRKMIGVKRIQLVLQFLSENLLLSFLALLFGLGLAEAVFIPLMNSIMVIKISLSFSANPELWAFLLGLLAFTSIASGAYPAMVISSLPPIAIFKSKSFSKSKGRLPRFFLAIQFILAFSTVIVGAVIVAAGRYWENVPWGYQPGHTLVVRLDHGTQFRFITNEALRSSYVLNAAGAALHIGESLAREIILTGQEKHEVVRYDVGAGYLEAMGIGLLAGRSFASDRLHEDARSVVVNKTFAQERQWANPIGQQFRSDGETWTVIGVVDDFKLIGSGAARPVVFHLSDETLFNYLVLRCAAGTTDEVEAFMRSAWHRLYPEVPFSFFHQNQVFENFYRTYNNVATVFSYLAGLALIIACLGLVGLASQNYAARLKEVSIRKVLGASVAHITLLANRVFLFILIVASVVATCICYVGVQLGQAAAKDFTGSMDLGIAPYVLANLLVFLTAAAAVSVQSYKLARISPAETLRNE